MKVCLAASESITMANRSYFIKHCRYSLVSFYYIRKWQSALFNSDLFLLDSGAFTFINNNGDTKNFDDYLTKYIKFIKKNDIKYFFELDVDVIVGYPKVLKMRERLEKETGKKCIPVWHKSRGLDEWYKLTKEYDYVAVGGFAIKDIKEQDFKYVTVLLDIAKQNGCKVHGLGFTNLKYIRTLHFYSVDSTTWQSGNRFGTIYEFQNNTLKQHSHPKGKRLKSGEDRAEMERHNIDAWIKYQKYADYYL